MTGNGISEAASEKRKRGRPQVNGDDWMAYLRNLFPEVKTVRGRQDVSYRLRAINVLGYESGYSWLFDKEKMMAGDGTWKAAILTELGRVQDDELMRALAERLCEVRPKTKDAIAMIRRARLDRPAKASASSLLDLLARTIDDYRTQHPGITWEEIFEALTDTYRSCEIAARENRRQREER